MAHISAVLQFKPLYLILIFVLTIFSLPSAVNTSRATLLAAPTRPPLLPTQGQLVGFRKDRIYLSVNGRSFHVEFLNTPGSIPIVSQASGPVIYNAIWPGINLSYDKAPGKLSRSIYTLDPGADPGRIRLKYSVPVEILPDGNLRLDLPGGAAAEPGPSAWQLVDGLHVPVPVGLVVWEDKEVSFSVGEYDPRYTLVIER